jgi:hypothetical protein
MGSARVRRPVRIAGVILSLLVAAAPDAAAADLWTETGRSLTSVNYWQGITFDAAAHTFNFAGPAQGLWRTNANLARLAGKSTGIPSTVKSTEGWNHVGDLSVDATTGGRLLVPLECYYPTASDPNTCKTGGLGVVDPVTLAWRYYVKLNPAELSKAMWAEVSPDGRWVWTSSGTDLLAYSTADVSTANAGPAGVLLTARKRVAGVLRASSVSGAGFWNGRLYLAYDRGTYIQVLSYPVDPVSGDIRTAWRLEIQRTKSSSLYETEGLAFGDALGGVMHWQVQPRTPFYSRIMHFIPAG